MKSQRKIALFLFVLLGVFTVSNFFNRPIQAALETPKAAAVETKPEATQQNKKLVSKYDYVAQPGDSYTVLARKAIQTYGIVNKVKLSQAQIIAAETTLTVKAGSPELNEGQKVSLEIASIKSAVEGAQKLSQTQLAEWQAYVADVDFNTNKVGQSV